ncbi:MAG: zf-HC2 domain-containing protein [Candidatus Eisenbacteria bacterium]|nr:zf-HC2 domain-containing protein [Candidatus Eisenbacteria bacterium]
MDCRDATRLVELELEGGLDADASARLNEHVRTCPGCAALRAELRAIDVVLAEERIEPAPGGFAAAVMAEVSRAASRRRVPDTAVVSGAAAVGLAGAVYGVARALGAGSDGALGRWVRDVLEGVRAGAAELASRVPGLDAGLWDNPAAAGVLVAFAAAGIVFFVVVLLRFPKQMSVEWR